MKIAEIISSLEQLAPPSLQEDYDNAGLITGNASWNCTGALCSLDATEEIIQEAKSKNCNLIVAHHPIVFRGLKKITGKNYVEKTIINAIKNDIAIYAIHTNLDNVIEGVNNKIADKLNLINRNILLPKQNTTSSSGQMSLIRTVRPTVQNGLTISGEMAGEITSWNIIRIILKTWL